MWFSVSGPRFRLVWAISEAGSEECLPTWCVCVDGGGNVLAGGTVLEGLRRRCLGTVINSPDRLT